jgi:pyridoxine kinase
MADTTIRVSAWQGCGTMGILSIQSHVSYGHVGNAAAVFILRRMGFDVWPVHTVLFSNHPGYGDFGGAVVAPEIIGDIIDGLEARALFPDCQAIIGGYLGSMRCGEIMLDAVHRVRAVNGDAMFYLDPVIGDRDTGVYVADEIVSFYRDHALARADVIKANAYELEVLTGEVVTDVASAAQAARSVINTHGTETVVVTSIPARDASSLATVAIQKDAAWVVTTPVLHVDQKGAGDAFMALLVANCLRHACEMDTALSRSVSSIWALMNETCDRGGTELLLIEAQEQIKSPMVDYAATSIT